MKYSVNMNNVKSKIGNNENLQIKDNLRLIYGRQMAVSSDKCNFE